MHRATFVVILLIGATASANDLKCLACTHAPGIYVDEDCLIGKTPVSQASSDPICVTFGLYDSNKRLIQVTRTSYPITNLPMANGECYQTKDLEGDVLYYISCTCNTSYCNNFLIDNCKCENQKYSGTTTPAFVSAAAMTPTPTASNMSIAMDPNASTTTTTTTTTTVNTTSTNTATVVTAITTITVVTTTPKFKHATSLLGTLEAKKPIKPQPIG